MNTRLTIKTTSIFLLLFASEISFGQSVESDSTKNIQFKMICSPALSWKKSPLYIISVDNKRLRIPEDGNLKDSLAIQNLINYVNPNWISSINILKEKDATNKYGILGQNGVVLIDLEKGSLTNFPPKIRRKFKHD